MVLLLLPSHQRRLGRGRQGHLTITAFLGLFGQVFIIIRFMGLPVPAWVVRFMSLNYTLCHSISSGD